jgi:selenide,water dikinase
VARRLVLLGAGHAHAEVLRAFARRPADGAALTLVSPYTHVPYTGMVPGVVAGRYALPEASIEAETLAARAGAAFVKAKALRIDRARKAVICDNGAELSYDVISINIGAVARNPLKDFHGARVLSTKPVEPFLAAIEAAMAGDVAVIGGGYGGIELAAALKYRGARVSLIAGREGLAPAAPAAARAMLARRLSLRGVRVIEGANAVGADSASVTLADGGTLAAQAVILAAGVVPPALVAALDLPKDEAGFLSVSRALQSPADPVIFAAGDCAAFGGLPKAGVYAVREGPILADNLRAALTGRPLAAYRPQSNYLSILSFWPQGAVAIRGRFAAEGGWADRWKEGIDRRFIARFRA